MSEVLPDQTRMGRVSAVARLGGTVNALAVVILALLGARASALAADQPAFAGKTVTIVVGYSVGGGFDLYARALARHLGRNIPGGPSVIVQNLPGAASLLAVRHLDANPAKDGTVLAMFDSGLILSSLVSPATMKTKLSDYRWIGAVIPREM